MKNMQRLKLIVILVLVISHLSIASYFIDINIPEYKLRLYYEDELVNTFPIAVGKSVTPSILGDFKIINVIKDPTWYPQGQEPVPPGKDNPLGPWWLGLDFPGYGIHGNNSPDSIGKALSAGCIRMNNDDVTYLAGVIKKGTPVRLRYDVFVATYSRGQVQIAVYPDIYRLGVATAENLRRFAANHGVIAESDDWTLTEFIKLSNSKFYPLPSPVDVWVNGKKYKGFKIADQYAVPLAAFGDYVKYRNSNKTYYLDTQKVRSTASNKEFAYLSSLEEDFWLGAEVGSGINFQIYEAYLNGQSLGRVLKKKEYLFDATKIAGVLGVSLYTNSQHGSALIDGQVIRNPVFYNDHLYLTAAQLADYLALGVEMDSAHMKAVVGSLPVFYNDTKLDIDGYVYSSKTYIPLSVFEHAGFEVEWIDRINERVKVAGSVLQANRARGNNFYIDADDFAKITGIDVDVKSAGIYLGGS